MHDRIRHSFTQTHAQYHARLDCRLVRNRRDRLRLVVLRRHRPLTAGHHRLPLQVHVHTLLLRLPLLDCVLLHTVDELFPAARVADVLDADVDALLNVAVADLSVKDDTDCGLGHVVDDAGLAVVDLVGLRRKSVGRPQSPCSRLGAQRDIPCPSAPRRWPRHLRYLPRGIA